MERTYMENEQVRLRALEPEDVDLLYKWENNAILWHLGDTRMPFSRFILKEYIETSKKDIYETKQLRLIIEHSEEFRPLGAIDLFDFDPFHLRAGVGILISNKEDRQKGYAENALSLLTRYAFELLGLKQIYCSISETNDQSLKLFIKQGFVITGQKKAWLKTNDGWITEYFLQLINSA